MPYTEQEYKLFELVTRILCDPLPETVDAVAIFGETFENEDSMLNAAARCVQKDRARFIAVSGEEGDHKGEFRVSSGKEYEEILVTRGVPRNKLVSFPLSTKFPPSTDAEAIGLVEYADRAGWTSIIVTVPPLHQVRAFISTVSAVLKANSPLRVYSFHGGLLSWTEEVFHSQSAPKAPRHEQFEGELGKLIRYAGKGDHASPEEILAYLNRRDTAK